MLADGEVVSGKLLWLAEVALGDTTVDLGMLLRVLLFVYSFKMKSSISAEFSKVAQSDLLSDLRQ